LFNEKGLQFFVKVGINVIIVLVLSLLLTPAYNVIQEFNVLPDILLLDWFIKSVLMGAIVLVSLSVVYSMVYSEFRLILSRIKNIGIQKIRRK